MFGKLSYKGEPAVPLLMFHIDGKPQSADLVVPSATAKADGSFELISPTGIQGLPDKYNVLSLGVGQFPEMANTTWHKEVCHAEKVYCSPHG